MNRMTNEKPPIGIIPHDIHCADRIAELAEAIERYSKESPISTHTIALWAREIIEQCSMIRTLNEWQYNIKGGETK